jgi:hypothetical protein
MKYLSPCLLAILVLNSAVAVGQVIYNTNSTAAGDFASGMGNVISAQGQKNLSDSQAAINLTEARSNQIDNQIKSVNAFWEKKGIYGEHQQAENEAIQAERARYLATNGLKSLTPEEFDRSTGQINWPKVLEQKSYDEYRTTLDSLFKKRAYDGFLSGDEYMSANKASKQWRTMIAKQKDQYPQNIMSQMIRFILKVDRELDDNLS